MARSCHAECDSWFDNKNMFGLNRNAKDKPAGYIYIASNKGMPGIIKIGMTYKAPARRLAELYTTGVPYPFVLEYQCRVPDRHKAERFLHDYFSEKRVTSKREFFAVDASHAAKITQSRVANKKVSYKKPLGKFKKFVVMCLIIAVGAGILYKTGHITEAVDGALPKIIEILRSLIDR